MLAIAIRPEKPPPQGQGFLLALPICLRTVFLQPETAHCKHPTVYLQNKKDVTAQSLLFIPLISGGINILGASQKAPKRQRNHSGPSKLTSPLTTSSVYRRVPQTPLGPAKQDSRCRTLSLPGHGASVTASAAGLDSG